MICRHIASEGDSIEVAPGDFRTVSALFVPNGPNAPAGSGLGYWFNDSYTLTYVLSFTDGSQGVFASSVPEPAMLSLLAITSLARVRKRRPCP